MAERDDWQDFERRCRLANMIVSTMILEALPTLQSEQWHHLESNLEKHIHGADEARAYESYMVDVEDSGKFFNVKSLKLSLQLEPPIAKVDIEMDPKAIGYIQGNSVHLFDD
jgi:hypothetical protein